MKNWLRALFVGAVVGGAYFLPSTPAKADDYWANHWNWYDNTYRPYYYRNYNYYSPGYSGYSNYGYGQGYYNNNYYGPGYGNYGYGTPYRNYYGSGNFGYGRTYGGGQAVNIGGMQFGWR
jgi:hypothetical protein